MLCLTRLLIDNKELTLISLLKRILSDKLLWKIEIIVSC